MNWLVQFADRNGCGLVLSGDTRQPHGVERGDALRILQNSGVVTQAVLKSIIRQQNTALRQAVIDLSQGRPEAGFDKLDNFGAIHEFEDKDERLAAIARTLLATRKEGKSSLIVAPTHAECRAIADLTTAIHRARLTGRNPLTRSQPGREPVREAEREIQR